MTRRQRNRILTFGLTFAVLVGLSLAYDRWIAAVSTTRAILTGTHSKCGPAAGSGPREWPGLRGPKRWMLMARLDDGRLIRVEREAVDLPPCGAAIKIEERVTPWGAVWYWTAQ